MPPHPRCDVMGPFHQDLTAASAQKKIKKQDAAGALPVLGVHRGLRRDLHRGLHRGLHRSLRNFGIFGFFGFWGF